MAFLSTIDWNTREAHAGARSKTGAHIPPRVLLADDQQEILGAIATMLRGEFTIVGLAENGAQVLDLVVKESPDVLVLDILMPVLNGLETAAWLKASGCPAKILFVTVQDDPAVVESAISVGALGYVLKPHLATDLIPAIRSVLEGRQYISSSVHSY